MSAFDGGPRRHALSAHMKRRQRWSRVPRMPPGQ